MQLSVPQSNPASKLTPDRLADSESLKRRVSDIAYTDTPKQYQAHLRDPRVLLNGIRIIRDGHGRYNRTDESNEHQGECDVRERALARFESGYAYGSGSKAWHRVRWLDTLQGTTTAARSAYLECTA